MGLFRFVRTNYAEARSSWTRLGEISAQCKNVTKRSKLEKLYGERAIERRTFLKASGSLAGFGALMAGGSTGLGLVIKHFIRSADELGTHFADSGLKFPFTPAYLNKLMNDGGVSPAERDKILSNNSGAGGLYALMAYSLLLRAKKMDQLSGRYAAFIDTVAPLIKDGRIKFETVDKGGRGDIDLLYELYDKRIYIDPAKIRNINNMTLVESSFIHELFHVFQDYSRRTLPYSRFEAEAHLAQSDFIFHIEPKLLLNRWVNIYPTQDGFKYKFLFSSSVVSMLKGLKDGDAAFEDAMTVARRNYLFVRVIQGSADPGMYQSLASQIQAGAKKEDVYRALYEQIETGLKTLQLRPLREAFTCVFSPVKGTGALGNCKPSLELIKFSTLVNFLIIYAWKTGDMKAVEVMSNYYFVDAWRKDADSLLDNSEIDSNLLLVGIGP